LSSRSRLRAVPPSETSVISNNSDSWYKANRTASPVPQGKDDASGEGSGKAEGAVLGLRSAQRRRQKPASSPCWRFRCRRRRRRRKPLRRLRANLDRGLLGRRLSRRS
jgi:hypothetical protein